MNVCFKRIKRTKSTKRKRKATISWRTKYNNALRGVSNNVRGECWRHTLLLTENSVKAESLVRFNWDWFKLWQTKSSASKRPINRSRWSGWTYLAPPISLYKLSHGFFKHCYHNYCIVPHNLYFLRVIFNQIILKNI